MNDIGKIEDELAETQRRLHEANERMLQALNEQASMTRRYTAAALLNKRLLEALVDVSAYFYGEHYYDHPTCKMLRAIIAEAEAALAKEVPHA